MGTNKVHVIAWTFFITYDLVFATLMSGLLPSPIIDPLHFAINIFFFYFNAHVTLPWALKSRFRAFYLLVPLLALQMTLYVLVHFGCDKLLIEMELIHLKKVYVLNMQVVTRNLYRGMYFLGFSTGYYYLKVYLFQRKKTGELERDKLYAIIEKQEVEHELASAQHAFLKAQINPHFLFNTLDFIYYNVKGSSPQAGEAVMRLSDMMRFAIDSGERGGAVELADEIQQVENLLQLYQLQSSEDLNLHFSYTQDVKTLRLVPLVLLTLVENIFKHGDLSSEESIAVLNLNIRNDKFCLQSRNRIAAHIYGKSNRSGLANIQKRLAHVYGSELRFECATVGEHFTVTIEIPVKVLQVPSGAGVAVGVASSRVI